MDLMAFITFTNKENNMGNFENTDFYRQMKEHNMPKSSILYAGDIWEQNMKMRKKIKQMTKKIKEFSNEIEDIGNE